MPDPAAASPKLLAYDVIASNRRRIRVLLLLFGVVLLPFAFWMMHQVGAYLVLFVLPLLLGVDAAFRDPALTVAVAAFLAVQLTVLLAYLAYRGAARRVLRVASGRPPAPGEEDAVRRTVESLCIGAGLPIPRVAVVDVDAINGFSTGLDPRTTTIVVTRGAVERLDRRELEALLAHEIVEIAARDTQVGTLTAGLVRFMWLPLVVVGAVVRGLGTALQAAGLGPMGARACLVAIGAWLGSLLLALVGAGVDLGVEMLRHDPVVGAVFLGLMALPFHACIVTPVAGLLMLRAMSRERVLRADADALLLTRHPGGLARALAKMSVAGNAAVAVPAAVRPLWVADPGPAAGHPWDALLRTHPALDERIAAVVAMGEVTDRELDAARAAGVVSRGKGGGR